MLVEGYRRPAWWTCRHAIALCVFFFFQAEDGIRDGRVTGVQTCALPISVGLLEKHPGAVAAPEVAHHERLLLPGDLGVQRREEDVVGETDIAVLATDGRVGRAPLEALLRVARLVEQHEDDGGARAWRDGGRASRLGLHERGAAGGAESRAGGDGRPAACAARPRAGRREPPPALRAERQQGAGVTAAERAGDRLAGCQR